MFFEKKALSWCWSSCENLCWEFKVAIKGKWKEVVSKLNEKSLSFSLWCYVLEKSLIWDQNDCFSYTQGFVSWFVKLSCTMLWYVGFYDSRLKLCDFEINHRSLSTTTLFLTYILILISITDTPAPLPALPFQSSSAKSDSNCRHTTSILSIINIF